MGHWGNQNEKTWADARWNGTDLGSLLCGIFRGAGATVPKGVCIRLGDRGELSACFNPQTLSYEAVWKDGFIGFSNVRHGFMDGLNLKGNTLPRPEAGSAGRPFVYHGFYRHGNRVVFSYKVGDDEILDAPWAADGKFTREVGPAATHSLAHLTKGGPAQWPQVFETRQARRHAAVRRRHDRAAVRQSLEDPPLPGRPRLRGRRHRLHHDDAGRRLAR